jgi:hypothetical protein
MCVEGLCRPDQNGGKRRFPKSPFGGHYKKHNVMRPNAAARYNGIAVGLKATALNAEVGCATPH